MNGSTQRAWGATQLAWRWASQSAIGPNTNSGAWGAMNRSAWAYQSASSPILSTVTSSPPQARVTDRQTGSGTI